MKVKLSQITLDISKIKQLHNKYKKLHSGLNKTTRPHYSVEFHDGTFTEITKQEYKLLKGILDNENKM